MNSVLHLRTTVKRASFGISPDIVQVMAKPTGNRILITNAAGKYLMQFRDNTPGINFPLMWDFFGGSSEGEETPVQGMLRELHEELNLDLTEDDLEEVAHERIKGVDEYLYRLKRPLAWDDFTIQEGAGAAFLTKEELQKLPISGFAQFFVERYL
jgi:8-oxo-dGTP diphosphatase